MRRAVLVVPVLLMLAQGCSLGPREDWAEAMRDAQDATRQRTAKVRMAADVKVIETVIRQEPEPLISRLEGTVDFGARRSRVVGTGPRKPNVVFDDLVVFLPRSSTSIAGGTRRWARFDFEREPSEDIDDNDRRRAVGAGVISPAVATELLEGVLTGSIRRVGSESVGGARATHYRAKISQDAAAREVEDEDRREGIRRLFESLGVQEDLFPADVWIDEQGLARRISFVLRQQKDRVNAFELRLAWEFYEYGPPGAEIKLPARSDTIASDRFSEFIEEYIREAA